MKKREAVDKEIKRLSEYTVGIEETREMLEEKNLPPLKAPVKASNLLTRQGVGYDDIRPICGKDLPKNVAFCVETEIRYAGYIEKQKKQVQKYASLEKKKLPKNFDYTGIKGIRLEAAAKRE